MFYTVASDSYLSFPHVHCCPFFASSWHSKVDKPVMRVLVPPAPASSLSRSLSFLFGTKSDFAPYTESRRLAAVSQLLGTL